MGRRAPWPRVRLCDREDVRVTDRGALRDSQVAQNRPNDGGVGEEGEDPHGPVAGGTLEGIDFVDAGEELSPAPAGAAAPFEVVAPSSRVSIPKIRAEFGSLTAFMSSVVRARPTVHRS